MFDVMLLNERKFLTIRILLIAKEVKNTVTLDFSPIFNNNITNIVGKLKMKDRAKTVLSKYKTH